ncbi:MAG: hypothetical protein HYX27_04925 [Acidobacteria bacterium]|nr:hypothetical protein [Acidobacteriota bacterium]
MLSLAIVSGLVLAAEPSAIRISAPSLGWVLAADGSQVVEISGLADSPRTGRAVSLPAVARRAWSSPDAASVLVQLDAALFLIRAAGEPEAIAELPAGVTLSAAWDRSSSGFAVCWETNCEARDAGGAIRTRWEVDASARVLAYSGEGGMVLTTADAAEWRRGGETVRIDPAPAAATFRPRSQELWIVDNTGQLYGQDFQGRRTGEGEMVTDAVGLIASADGRYFFASNAEGNAAVFDVDSGSTNRTDLETTVEGVWLSPGPFSARLHESSKRAIAIWTDVSIGWVPSANGEVRQ